jgi:Protein of unknown function (DUF3866)
VPHFVTRSVTSILSERDGLQRVALDDASGAYVLTAVTGPVATGDRVVVNTTAVDLGLGTGGWHVVHWNLERDAWAGGGGGHILKVRYTSVQTDTGAAEERDGDVPTELAGMPVVVCGLHSQIAPVAAGIRAQQAGCRVAYVMTDAAALPLALSDLVFELRCAGFLDLTVSAGQAFGGEVEAVNVPSALCLARQRGADIAIVAMGPGGVGTSTELGFGALEVGSVLDAAAWLGGTPIACVRYTTADGRHRHDGVSHHTITTLGRATHHPAVVPVPAGELADAIQVQLTAAGIARRHRVVTVEVPDVMAALDAAGIEVATMGRRPADDPAFFTVAGAAGAAAAGSRYETGTVQS